MGGFAARECMPSADTTMPMRAEPGSRNLWVFGATSFLNDTASEMAY
jgi:hypothetical protein